MSIAVSTVVKRSGWLSIAVSAMCMSVILIGVLIAANVVGELNVVERMTVATICIGVAAMAYVRVGALNRQRTLHISGSGQIRLANDLSERQQSVRDTRAETVEIVYLQPASTLWNWLLILHLKHEDERTSIMTILPDSVSENDFRALLVACRWIAMRHAEEVR